jgi:hypothetical protein
MNAPTHRISPADRALLEQAAVYCDRQQLTQINAQKLRQIALNEGIDFATAVLYQNVVQSEKYCQLPGCVERRTNPPHVVLAIVPGAFYVEHPETGADGRRLLAAAESLGYETELIRTASVGTLAANAETIVAWLRHNREKRVVLASLSKGGADVKTALQAAPEAFANVLGWINIGGTTEGSPIVSWILSRRFPALIAHVLFWWRGRNMQFLYDLNRKAGGPINSPVRVPPHLRVIHVVGFPLRWHLSTKRARIWHRRLTPEGPNDGATVLLDSCRLPGVVYPVWGADHYAADRVDWLEFTRGALQYFESPADLPGRASYLSLAELGA